MGTLVDNSNGNDILTTIGLAMVMLRLAAIERDITVKRWYVKDDAVIVAFANGTGKKSKKYSLEVPISGELLNQREFIVRSSVNSALPQKTTYDNFIDWKGLT